MIKLRPSGTAIIDVKVPGGPDLTEWSATIYRSADSQVDLSQPVAGPVARNTPVWSNSINPGQVAKMCINVREDPIPLCFLAWSLEFLPL